MFCFSFPLSLCTCLCLLLHFLSHIHCWHILQLGSHAPLTLTQNHRVFTTANISLNLDFAWIHDWIPDQSLVTQVLPNSNIQLSNICSDYLAYVFKYSKSD